MSESKNTTATLELGDQIVDSLPLVEVPETEDEKAVAYYDKNDHASVVRIYKDCNGRKCFREEQRRHKQRHYPPITTSNGCFLFRTTLPWEDGLFAMLDDKRIATKDRRRDVK